MRLGKEKLTGLLSKLNKFIHPLPILPEVNKESHSASEESPYFKYSCDFRLIAAFRNFSLASEVSVGNWETQHLFHSCLRLHTKLTCLGLK